MKSKPALRRILFEGLEAIELLTPSLRLVAVTALGPRLAFWGQPRGENLLYWAPGKHRRGEWDLLGGHRVWVTRPGADESEETCAPDNGPCEAVLLRDGFTVTGAPDPATRTRRGLTVRVLAADRIAIDHFVRNESDLLWSGGLWALTCTVPARAAAYAVPLGDGSRWDYATVVMFKNMSGQGGDLNDPQFTFTAEALLLRPTGRVNKRMVKADAGIIALHDPVRRVLFAKQADYFPNGSYPLGTNLALYVAPKKFMVEMETMGPAAVLKPGQSLTHTETWVLRRAVRAMPAAAKLRKLFE